MMKISLQREEWLIPLQIVSNVLEKKQAKPILSHLLIKRESDNLVIIGTDTDIELHGIIHVESSIENDQCITLPGRKFLDICRLLPDNERVDLVENAGRIDLICEKSRFTMPSLPFSDFPLMPKPKMEIEFSIPCAELATLIKKTIFAVPHQDIRKYLNGLLFEIKQDSLLVLATDGHRLATRKAKLSLVEDYFAQIIVPKKTVITLLKLLGDMEGDANVGINDSFIWVDGKSFTLLSRLIGGKFPDYSRIIPKKGKHSVTINCGLLKKALIRVGILANELFRSVHIGVKEGIMILDANNPEHEEASEELSVDYRGKVINVVFNIGYFLDVLNVINESNDIKIFFSEAGDSIIVEEIPEEAGCFHVLMSIRQ